ncbi:MAG: hypothetical protein OEV28_00225 [Nitrospirota bacterium]|nr:hypothetical protein [Nitrospirota bacterium]
MVEVNSLKSPQLVEAIVVWTGWGRAQMPSRDDARLVDHFGADVATKLLPIIKALEDDFYSSNARFIASDIAEMEKLAAAQFRQKQPEVAEEIVKAFSWCYTFDFR